MAFLQGLPIILCLSICLSLSGSLIQGTYVSVLSQCNAGNHPSVAEEIQDVSAASNAQEFSLRYSAQVSLLHFINN